MASNMERSDERVKLSGERQILTAYAGRMVLSARNISPIHYDADSSTVKNYPMAGIHIRIQKSELSIINEKMSIIGAEKVRKATSTHPKCARTRLIYSPFSHL